MPGTRFDRIVKSLEGALQPEWMLLEDESHQHSSGPKAESHYKLVVASKIFEGLSRIERSQKVYQLLETELQSGLHALTQRLYTPEEWVKIKDEFKMVSPTCQSKKAKSQKS